MEHSIRIALVLKGASGAGKSTLANNLALLGGGVVCEADNYFIDPRSGEYKFDATKLGEAHAWCKRQFVDALAANVPLVICANTNTIARQYEFYVDKAKEFGYIVHVVVVERFMNTSSIHNVPSETINKQIQRLKQSIKF